MRHLNTILLVLILVAVCAGGALLYLGKLSIPAAPAPTEASAAPATPPPPAPTPIFLALDPFTVTLQDEHLPQILYLEITVRIIDQDARNYLIEYMPEVRNRILTELSRHTATKMQRTEGRIALADSLRKIIAAPYPPRQVGPEVVNVLFTAFVVQ